MTAHYKGNDKIDGEKYDVSEDKFTNPERRPF